jgi:hypothetical protein
VRAAIGLALAVGVACSSSPRTTSGPPAAELADTGPDDDLEATAGAPVAWLKGSTHVHAAPSGDASLDVPGVIAWYEAHGYDFIVLTDHNKVSTLEPAPASAAAVRFPDSGLVVLAGIELTYNPGACQGPAPEPDGKCRIHVNGLGVEHRPAGKVEWADRAATERLDMYRAATRWITAADGLVQLNHPQWHWGMTPALLRALAADGVTLVEIANAQFTRWNAGDATHPSTEALWDDSLTAGHTLWGVASDDAHDYRADGGGKYPAGGAWIMVDAPRHPAAIVDAIREGRFYASTGVTLARAGVVGAALVVEVDEGSPGDHVIRFIGAGRVLRQVTGRRARFPLAEAPGYVRAVVDGPSGRAWVQPARP